VTSPSKATFEGRILESRYSTLLSAVKVEDVVDEGDGEDTDTHEHGVQEHTGEAENVLWRSCKSFCSTGPSGKAAIGHCSIPLEAEEHLAERLSKEG